MLTLVVLFYLLLVYPEATERSLKVRVDDDVAVYQGTEALVDSHAIDGWQWTTVYDATLYTNLLVITAYNQVRQ